MIRTVVLAVALLLAQAIGPATARVLGQGPATATAPTPMVDGPAVTREGSLRVHHWPAQRRLAGRLIESARTPLPALPDDLLRSGGPVDVYLAPDAARFDSLTDGRAPEWGAGIAFPEAGVIVLPVYASDRAQVHQLARILRHELAHIALHRHMEPVRIPRWFHEGYARWAAGEWNWQAAWHLRLAFLLRNTPPLDSLALRWPAGSTDARVAYLLSTSAVAFLVDRGGGVRGLQLFLERWRETGSLDRALRRTYGLTLGQFEEDWRKDVRSSYGWTFFLTDTLLFWAFAGLLLILLFWIRRRRDRARLERLRATEPPDEPAFWLEGTGREQSSSEPEDDGNRSPGPGQSRTGQRPGEGGGGSGRLPRTRGTGLS